MGFIGSILNPSKGAGFEAGNANIINQENLGKDYNFAQHHAHRALNAQEILLGQLQAQNGLQNQTDVYNQQQALSQQLQQQAMGGGPNPAQAALAQATQANTANQAALMAGQRGTQANAGMLARQASMAGAQNQQQTVGQAALMQAQQQVQAQQMLQQQQNMMGGMTNQQVANQMGGFGAYTQAAQGQEQNIFNAISGSEGTKTKTDSINQQQQQGVLGGQMGILTGAASAVMPKGKAQGGMIGYSHGGPVSKCGQYLNMKAGGAVPGQASVQGDSNKNDTVPAMLSPGEVVIPRSVMQSKDPAKAAAAFVSACLAKRGM